MKNQCRSCASSSTSASKPQAKPKPKPKVGSPSGLWGLSTDREPIGIDHVRQALIKESGKEVAADIGEGFLPGFTPVAEKLRERSRESFREKLGRLLLIENCCFSDRFCIRLGARRSPGPLNAAGQEGLLEYLPPAGRASC